MPAISSRACSGGCAPSYSQTVTGSVCVALGSFVIAASAFARAQAEGYPGLLAAVMLFGRGGPIVSAGAPKVVAELFQKLGKVSG